MCCGRLQQCAANPSTACINSSKPEGEEAAAQATPVEQPAAIDSDNGSSDTVSVSSERSLEVRQHKWKVLTERYRSAKYLAAKRKSTAKLSQTSEDITRMSEGRMGKYFIIGQECWIEVTVANVRINKVSVRMQGTSSSHCRGLAEHAAEAVLPTIAVGLEGT